MRRRLYFVLPDLKSADTIQRELLLARIESGHIHFLARDGINLGQLSVANLLQKSDLVHGLEIGLAAGGLTGVLSGLVISQYPELGSMVGMGAVLLLGLFGAIVGAWTSGMIAVSIPNSRLKGFQQAIDAGRILLMADVPYRRIGEIRRLIEQHHPEAHVGGQDTRIPAFP
jgi:MFS family permease